MVVVVHGFDCIEIKIIKWSTFISCSEQPIFIICSLQKEIFPSPVLFMGKCPQNLHAAWLNDTGVLHVYVFPVGRHRDHPVGVHDPESEPVVVG